jgi:hypothetical protein
MLRCFITATFIITVTVIAFSQGKNNSLKGVPFKERIVTGGGLGLSFGRQSDFFSVSPVIGYRLTNRLLGGTGITYRYTNYKIFKPSIKLNDYGVNPFLRFTFYRNIFVQTEFEYLNYEFPVSQVETTRQNFNSFLGGGGFIQPIGKNVFLYLMALYNFSYRDPIAGQYSPYDSPLIIRGGLNIGNLGIF